VALDVEDIAQVNEVAINVRATEIVDHDNFVAGLDQLPRRVRADEAAPTCD
jgi:hypothetical protein